MNPPESEDKDDRRTVFVGNLPYKVTWKALKDHFSQFGQVNYAKVITDYVTHKPKGYGFVEFSTIEGADRAVGASDSELQCQGRLLRVNLAYTRGPTKKLVETEVVRKPDEMDEDKKSSTKKKGKDDNSVLTSALQFSQLPDDILILILGYLSPFERVRVERVCKRWQQCARAASKSQTHLLLEMEVKRGSFQVFTEHKFHHILKHYSQNLYALDVSRVSTRLGNKALEIIGHCCKNVQVLDISGMSCSNSAFISLTEQCTKIKSLTCKSCDNIGEKGFRYLFKNCKSLEFLDCSGNSSSGNNGITGKFLKNAEKSLKHLRLDGSSSLTDDGLMHIMTRCPDLETLKIDSCTSVTTEGVSKALKCLPNLKELGAGEIKLSRSSVHPIHFVVNPSQLTVLSLFHTNLQDIDLQCICQKCVSLRELDISCNFKLTDVSLTQLASLKHLEWLSACHLYSVTNASLILLAQAGQLKVLRVQGCNNLTDEFVKVLTSRCLQLEEIDIAGASSLGLDSLQHFFLHATQREKCNLFVYIDASDFTYDYEFHFPTPPGLKLVTTYRRLYKHTAEMRLNNFAESFFFVHENDMDYINDEPQVFMDNDYVDYDEYDEELLLNDDPLEMERFDMS